MRSPSGTSRTRAAKRGLAPPLRTPRQVVARMKALADPWRAAHNLRFFKTGPGEYGEGDRMLGLTLPQIRGLVRQCDLTLAGMGTLLHDPRHEVRLLALLLMVRAYGRGSAAEQTAIHRSYLKNTRYINNWDLVDCSAGSIVGRHLEKRSRATLTRLARSRLLWDRRIAIIATLAFIVKGESAETLRIARILLADRHDLIHKAVGWMLREVGKRCDTAILTGFLEEHAATMPRTALRYAIERLPRTRQVYFLSMKARAAGGR